MEFPKVNSAIEERLNALIQNGVDLIGILDEHGIYKYASPSVKSILGYEEDYLIGKKAFGFIHPNDLKFVEKEFLSLLPKEEAKAVSFRFRHADGTWRWIDTIATNLLKNPDVQGIVINSRDVTERKEKEAERELIITELSQVNNDLKQFSFIASHNLRAPLSNIQGLLGLINKKSLDDENRTLIQLIEDSTKQLKETINDISDILVFKNNRNISIEYINMKKMFNHINNIFFSTENSISATVATNFLEETVCCNKVYLESIITNLISNAIKYRAPDRALVIRAETFKNEKGNTIFKFSDNGMGIDLSRNKDKIFGMYQRFHENIEGTGLGLFLVKTQIEAVKGKIDVESDLNKGTTFIINFPSSLNNDLDKEVTK